MKRIFSVVCAAVLVASASTAYAQSPSEQFGFGASIGWFGAGGHLAYAITPAIHVGTQFGLDISDGNSDLTFAPYGKFILAGSKELKPFFIGQFIINSNSGGGDATTGLRFGAGAEYFVSKNLGIFAQIRVLDIPFSPSGSKVAFGIATPAIGAEWFL